MSSATDGINFFAPDVIRDPFPAYVALQRDHPVCRVEPGGFVGVSRYEDVARVLKTPELFSSAGFRPAFEPPWVGHNPGAHNMLVMDPPEQTRNRVLIQHAFSPGNIAKVAPRIRAYINAIADQIRERGDAEMVGEFCSPVSAGVLGIFVDLDPALHATFRHWTNTLSSLTPEPLNDDHARSVRQVIAEMEDFFGTILRERAAAPGADIISQLTQAQLDGQALTHDELVGFLFLMLVAGLETTSHLMSKAILTLSAHPELIDELRANPALIGGFMHEQLRHDPPTHNLFRITVADTTIAGVPIAAGTPILAMVAAANRDARQFSEPDRFDMRRNTQGMLSFGVGPHYCLGAALARLEAQTAFEALLSRFKRFERLDDTIAWNPSMITRGPSALNIRTVPA